MQPPQRLRLYNELASWWLLLSPRENYAEEAELFWQLMADRCTGPLKTILELGSGGGNNASFLKVHAQMTLADRAPGMLAVSRQQNPECEHIEGDMRTVRLERQFDAVFVHDAVVYMTTPDDLRRTMETAYLHCRPGGVALFAPDWVRETFTPGTECAGHDADERGQQSNAGSSSPPVIPRGLRYVEWVWDPDPADSTYVAYIVYVLRESGGQVRVEYDRHICGLFARADWLGWLEDTGFTAECLPGPDERDVFIGKRPVR